MEYSIPRVSLYSAPGHKENAEFDMKQAIDVQKEKNDLTADELFFSNQVVLMTDYYCLKPDSEEDPKQWHRYEAAGFREDVKNIQGGG